MACSGVWRGRAWGSGPSDLLVAGNGTKLLFSAAAAAGPYNCEEVTDPVPIAH